MPGKLDEISEAIGALRAGVRNVRDDISAINGRMAAFEAEQDRRHGENQRAIHETAIENREAVEASKKAVQDIMNLIGPLSTAVNAMSPIVATYQISRWKKAGALSLALILLSALGWLAEAAIIKAIGWMMRH